jgi:hypothetical protein
MECAAARGESLVAHAVLTASEGRGEMHPFGECDRSFATGCYDARGI